MHPLAPVYGGAGVDVCTPVLVGTEMSNKKSLTPNKRTREYTASTVAEQLSEREQELPWSLRTRGKASGAVASPAPRSLPPTQSGSGAAGARSRPAPRTQPSTHVSDREAGAQTRSAPHSQSPAHDTGHAERVGRSHSQSPVLASTGGDDRPISAAPRSLSPTPFSGRADAPRIISASRLQTPAESARTCRVTSSQSPIPCSGETDGAPMLLLGDCISLERGEGALQHTFASPSLNERVGSAGNQHQSATVRPKSKRRHVLPETGPGSWGDPLRRGLNGSRCKWYVRYLQQGMSPEDARKAAQERPAGPARRPPSMPMKKYAHPDRRREVTPPRSYEPRPGSSRHRAQSEDESEPTSARREESRRHSWNKMPDTREGTRWRLPTPPEIREPRSNYSRSPRKDETTRWRSSTPPGTQESTRYERQRTPSDDGAKRWTTPKLQKYRRFSRDEVEWRSPSPHGTREVSSSMPTKREMTFTDRNDFSNRPEYTPPRLQEPRNDYSRYDIEAKRFREETLLRYQEPRSGYSREMVLFAAETSKRRDPTPPRAREPMPGYSRDRTPGREERGRRRDPTPPGKRESFPDYSRKRAHSREEATRRRDTSPSRTREHLPSFSRKRSPSREERMTRRDTSPRRTREPRPGPSQIQPPNYRGNETNVKPIIATVSPVGYPSVVLDNNEAGLLEDILAKAMILATGSQRGLISFGAIKHRNGTLILKAMTEEAVAWLNEQVPRLKGWHGPPLTVEMGNSLHPSTLATIYLPRCAGEPVQFLLKRLEVQNAGLRTNLWKVVSAKEEGHGKLLRVLLEKGSVDFIVQQNLFLFYRFGKIPVHGLGKQRHPASDLIQLD